MGDETIACEHCDGAGVVEYSEDRFDPTRRGGHYTIEHREDCRACDGRGWRFAEWTEIFAADPDAPRAELTDSDVDALARECGE